MLLWVTKKVNGVKVSLSRRRARQDESTEDVRALTMFVQPFNPLCALLSFLIGSLPWTGWNVTWTSGVCMFKCYLFWQTGTEDRVVKVQALISNGLSASGFKYLKTLYYHIIEYSENVMFRLLYLNVNFTNTYYSSINIING